MASPSATTTVKTSRKLKIGSVFPSKAERRSKRLAGEQADPGANSPNRLQREIRAQKRWEAQMESVAEETATIPDANLLTANPPDHTQVLPSAPSLHGAEGEGTRLDGDQATQDYAKAEDQFEDAEEFPERPSEELLKMTLAETETYLAAHKK